jgi:hypothetical protein
MTRSIGDRYGPRSCLAVPDVTAVKIRNDEYVRIVIASDGVWDVLKNSEVRDQIFLDRSAEDAACRIVNRAHVERQNRRLRMDDITAIVIDVNPELFPTFKLSSLFSSHTNPRMELLSSRGTSALSSQGSTLDAAVASAADGGSCCVIS